MLWIITVQTNGFVVDVCFFDSVREVAALHRFNDSTNSISFLTSFYEQCSAISSLQSHFQKQPREVFHNGVLRNFEKITGKYLCLRPATLSEKRLWQRYLPVDFAKFLRTPFSQNTSGRLLLHFEMTACFQPPRLQEFFASIWYTQEK